MNILIIYGTEEGHTGRIARFLDEKITGMGHTVAVIDADGPDRPRFDGQDKVILAASVHQRRHPRTFEALVAASIERLNAMPTLMLSVSLNASFPEGREEAQDYLDEMKMRTGLKPTSEMLVPGAIRMSRYDYFAMQVVRHVVLRGRDVDIEKDEHVFTDWGALEGEVADFLGGKS